MTLPDLDLEDIRPTAPAVVLFVHPMDPGGAGGALFRALSVCGRQASAETFPCGDRATWQAELVDGPLTVRVGLCDRHHEQVRAVPTLVRLWRVASFHRPEVSHGIRR